MFRRSLECAAVGRSIDCGIAVSPCFGRGGGLRFLERSPTKLFFMSHQSQLCALIFGFGAAHCGGGC